jgi:hypothetical protein
MRERNELGTLCCTMQVVKPQNSNMRASWPIPKGMGMKEEWQEGTREEKRQKHVELASWLIPKGMGTREEKRQKHVELASWLIPKDLGMKEGRLRAVNKFTQ